MWDYFAEINRVVGTNYKFIMRMDEESFFHSPINYDLFHYMGAHDYEYAYRICSYEMNVIRSTNHAQLHECCQAHVGQGVGPIAALERCQLRLL
jgi:hypothetical protein